MNADTDVTYPPPPPPSTLLLFVERRRNDVASENFMAAADLVLLCTSVVTGIDGGLQVAGSGGF